MRQVHCLAALLFTTVSAFAAPKERWVYLPANFQVDAEADRVIGLMKRAKSAGYTHALLADSKFSRLGDVIPRYFTNAERVREEANRLKIGIIPAVFPIGYSNSLLFHDPNLAEGLPVRNSVFEVRDGIARHVPDGVRLTDGTMSDRKAWAFVDDNLTEDNGAMRSGPTNANSRLAHKLALTPFRQYHVSVRVKTAKFTGSSAEIKVLAADGTNLQWTNSGVKPDQEWTTHHVTFNSLSNTSATLYFGVWGGHQGDIWWDDASIRECGPVNLLRRPGTPLAVRIANGRELKEGTDFEPLKDPLLGIHPWPGEYTAWHEPPSLKTRGIPDGTRLLVSYFHPHIIYDGQVCVCPSEPATMRLLEDQANRIGKLWGAQTHMMSHDEWRVLGWDDACKSRHLTPGQIAAADARACASILKRTAPGARIAVWSDMFDPFHNATDRYYLVNGTLSESWNGLDPSVLIVNWNSGKAAESLGFFAKRGHRQILAGYYDSGPASIRPWLAAAKRHDGVIGVMYTTWRNNYNDLEAFARELEQAGF
ncbi:MAG: hypothetical protein J0M04_11665 [Verrucomicrobia bacterium]|nr:hypothetical protein [Verrucomicrobiota bacterium]